MGAAQPAQLPVAAVANTLYLVPFLAIVIGWWALGEQVHPVALGGGAVALAGVAISRSPAKATFLGRSDTLESLSAVPAPPIRKGRRAGSRTPRVG